MKYERVNYHTHCRRCRHAQGAVEEYVRVGVEEKLDRLGFSDHMPFPDDRFGSRMPYAEMEEYLEEVAALKEQMAGTMEILCGFEGEYVREETAYYEKLLADQRCDYLILGQHVYQTSQGESNNVYFVEGTGQYEEYSRNVVEAMRTGYFRYVAHPDLFLLNCPAWDIHCDRACDILVDGAVKYGFPLEYNANGLRRKKQMYADGERYPYPHEKLWDRVKNSGIKVYVGSDCHNPDQLYDEYVLKAYRTLEEKGIAVATDWQKKGIAV